MPKSAYDDPVPRTATKPTPATVFHAVADDRRREILDVLCRRESAVGDLVDRLGLPQPQVSKHLKVLRDAGLVRCRAVGRRRIYRANGHALRPMQQWLRRFERDWNERYDRLDELLAEQEDKEKRP